MTDWKERAERAEAELARLRETGPEMRRGTSGDGTPWMGTMLDVLNDYKQAADTEAHLGDEARAELARLRAQEPVAYCNGDALLSFKCGNELPLKLSETRDGFYKTPLYRDAPPAQPAEPVQRLSDAGIEALAGKHGTTYRNRHFPTQPAFSFSNGSLHRFVRDIESAIQPQPGWCDVESAPKDGSSYLVADAERGLVAPHVRGVIHNNPGTNWDWQYGEAVTHWMPIPPAPKATP